MLIIDGDVAIYHSCKPRYLDSLKDDTYFTELDSDGHKIIPTYSEEEDRIYLEECWQNLKNKLNFLFDKFYTDNYLMAVAGSHNYRNYMYDLYKANRHKRPNPVRGYVRSIRERAIKEELAIESAYAEADDLMRTWSEECRFNNIDYVICTIDKDLKCIPGKYYNMAKDTLENISEQDAMRHFYEQLLKGDSVDNIPGLFRVGDVKARKWLEPYSTEEEFQEVVVSKYIEYYGDGWYDQLLSNGKLLYLQKHELDFFNLRHWPLVQELRSL